VIRQLQQQIAGSRLPRQDIDPNRLGCLLLQVIEDKLFQTFPLD
jgi:hypothetical protein